MIEEGIDPGDHHTREMYARYGLAMYFAQVVEAGIKNALVMAELADAKFATVEDFDVAAATNFKTVLGRLVEKIKPFLADDEPLVDDLRLALMTRNQLVHHFFWDHAPKATTWDGRERMMRECDAATELFQDTSTRLEAVVRAYATATGTSPAVFDDRLAVAHEDLLSRNDLLGARNCGRCLIPMVPTATSTREYFACPTCGAVSLV